MKFDKSQDSSWNALVVYVNSQCILAGSKPQKKYFVVAFYLKYLNISKKFPKLK